MLTHSAFLYIVFRNQRNHCSFLKAELGSTFKAKGIANPMLYIGMPGTIFALHSEDVDLYAMSLHHFGGIKTWLL